MKFAIENMINEVTINFNKFCSFVENIIVDNLNDIVIVTIKICR
jgi:hypothetical protein